MESCSNHEPHPNEWAHKVVTYLTGLRHRKPLIQCITNFVSMDLMANILLSAGASPAMIHSMEEIPDFTPNVNALCINVGTLSPDWLLAMKAAVACAAKSGKPWVLDPVAAGASSFRLSACLELLEMKPTIIRGNASEIIALSRGAVLPVKGGVDSCYESEDAIGEAKSLARASGTVVAVSGATDVITDGERVVRVHNGVAMLQKITAAGCAVTALIAAFVAIDHPHALEAAASALSIFGIAAEIGMEMASGPASLRVRLIDTLHSLEPGDVLLRLQICNS